MGVFYAREPYSNADAVHVTRFIGLAPVGNKEKQVTYPSVLCVIDYIWEHVTLVFAWQISIFWCFFLSLSFVS